MRKIFTGLLLLLCMQGYSQQINYAEYFIDNAVAVGSGTPISIVTPADSINISINIPSTGLAAGFHSLNIRVRYNTGVWGMFENRVFYVKSSEDNLISPKIAKAEYFFDNDTLGVGKRTLISTGSLADSVNITNNISTIGLSAGFHSLSIRAQDSAGIWGMLENRVFYVKSSQDYVVSPKIAKAEYFFDSDTLGVGKRTTISTGSLADSVNITNNISTAGLTTGFHNLNIRTQDSAGIWGMFESRLFYIDQNNLFQNSPKIVSAEYFYNTDPGMGNGTAISPSFASADSINLNRNMLTTGLPSGIDTLYVRVKDSTGMWSLPFSKSFRICATAPNAPNINGNTSYSVCSGANISFSATPASGATIFWRGPNGFIATSNAVSLTSINSTKTGTYFAYSVTGATACDTSSATTVVVSISTPISQSLTVNGSLNLCTGDSLSLSIPTQSGNSYRWLRNGTNTTNNADTLNSLVVKTSGTYTVKVTNASGCFINMRDTIVTVNPKPNTSAINGNVNVMASSTQTYNVTNSNGSNYNWSVTNGTINNGNGTNSISVTWGANTGTGSVSVIETNVSGCIGDTQTLSINISSFTLNVNPLSLSYTNTASSKKVGITSNTNWSVSSNQTWATVNKANGTNNDSITITVTANSTFVERTATITFNAGSLTQTVSVTQNARIPDSLNLDINSLTFTSSGSTKQVQLTSNRSWTAIGKASWVTLTPSAGNGNTVLDITTSANTSSSIRTNTITFTAGLATKTLLITQDATVSVSEINKNNYLNIYPNPTTGIVTIASTQAIANIDVFDVTGKLVYNQQNNTKQTNTSLDLSNLSNGIYFINVHTENGGISNSKVVVSK